jgi:hypothetical protein
VCPVANPYHFWRGNRCPVVERQPSRSKRTQGGDPSCNSAATARATQSSSCRKRKRPSCGAGPGAPPGPTPRRCALSLIHATASREIGAGIRPPRSAPGQLPLTPDREPSRSPAAGRERTGRAAGAGLGWVRPAGALAAADGRRPRPPAGRFIGTGLGLRRVGAVGAGRATAVGRPPQGSNFGTDFARPWHHKFGEDDNAPNRAAHSPRSTFGTARPVRRSHPGIMVPARPPA